MSSRPILTGRIHRRNSDRAANIDWTEAFAPSLYDIQTLANAAFATLPAQFRSMCADLVIRVDELPDGSALTALGIDNPFDLLGLFQGLGLAQRGAIPFSGQLPNTIYLYRRPLLEYWNGHEETLGAIITHVLIHEVGHHFGLSDEDMERIEQAGD